MMRVDINDNASKEEDKIFLFVMKITGHFLLFLYILNVYIFSFLMIKASGFIDSISGSSVNVSISENLKTFPSVAKKMEICYATIADILEMFDKRTYMSEELFSYLDGRMQEEINTLDDCLMDVFWNEVEIDRFNRMEKYYYEVRGDCIEYLMSTINPSYYNINMYLHNMFDVLSNSIISFESHPFLKKYLHDCYKQLKIIKNILESEKYQEQLSISQYNTWGDKYKSAVSYLKKLRSEL